LAALASLRPLAGAYCLGGLVAAGAATGHSVGSVVVLGLGVLGVLAVALAVRVPIFAGMGDRVEHPVVFASVGALGLIASLMRRGSEGR